MSTARVTGTERLKKPLWIVQNNGIDRVTRRIAKSLQEQGRHFVDVSVHTRDSFEKDLTTRLGEENLDAFMQPTFFMGSVLLLESMLASARYNPLATYHPENYTTQAWCKAHGNRMLNDAFELMTLEGALNLGEPVFVRPLTEQKLFTGAVIEKSSFQGWFTAASQRNSRLTMQSQVSVSKPKEILREWRVLCFNGIPKLWSQYKESDRLEVNASIEPDALAFATEAAAHWVPDELCTLDVAKTSEGYRIVEFNGMHCCGIYAIDVNRFIKEVDYHLENR